MGFSMSYFNNVTEVAINMHQYVSVIFSSGWIVEDRHYLFAVKEGNKRQPHFIHQADGQPMFMAVIGSTPFERGDEAEGAVTHAVGNVKNQGAQLIQPIWRRIT